MPEVNVVYICVRCGFEYPPNVKEDWGRNHGVGYGGLPVCYQVVPDLIRKSNAVCRGDLVPTTAS